MAQLRVRGGGRAGRSVSSWERAGDGQGVGDGTGWAARDYVLLILEAMLSQKSRDERPDHNLKFSKILRHNLLRILARHK